MEGLCILHVVILILQYAADCEYLAIVYIAVGDAGARVAGVYDGAISGVDSNVSAVAYDVTGLHLICAHAIAYAAVC